MHETASSTWAFYLAEYHIRFWMSVLAGSRAHLLLPDILVKEHSVCLQLQCMITWYFWFLVYCVHGILSAYVSYHVFFKSFCFVIKTSVFLVFKNMKLYIMCLWIQTINYYEIATKELTLSWNKWLLNEHIIINISQE